MLEITSLMGVGISSGDMSSTWGKISVRIIEGDITDQDVDAIVNAANSSLTGGGGVDGAIHRKGGPMILEDCRRILNEEWPEGLPTGKAVLTRGGRLKARHVIHTVGPIWSGGNEGEPEALAHCYGNSLDLAAKHDLESVAFPSISTGAYGYPITQASRIALRTVRECAKKECKPKQVTFVLFSDEDLGTYLRVVQELE